MFCNSPSGGSENTQLMHPLAITAARRSIEQANSCDMPDAMAIQLVVDAARLGVKVRIIVPNAQINSHGVFSSGCSTNFDSRSFRLNHGANLNLLNLAFGANQESGFDHDCALCGRITPT